MTAPQLATFLGKHLGPTLEKKGLWPATKLTYGGRAPPWYEPWRNCRTRYEMCRCVLSTGMCIFDIQTHMHPHTTRIQWFQNFFSSKRVGCQSGSLSLISFSLVTSLLAHSLLSTCALGGLQGGWAGRWAAQWASVLLRSEGLRFETGW